MDQAELVIIVGLGNVGERYAATRHNLGFMVVDELASSLHAGKFSRRAEWQVDYLEHRTEDHKIILTKPNTMMNLSGQAVAQLVDFYKAEPQQVWVVHDEIDLPFGTLRLQEGGSSAGHRGVESIIKAIGLDFKRARVGVANDSLRRHIDTEVFVLQPFNTEEKATLPEIVETVTNSLRAALTHKFTSETITIN